jgi:ABC-type enterochelin transport system permease subunit
MDAQEMWQMLMKYDRELVAPRFEEVSKRFDTMVTRDEFNGHMDRIYQEFQRIDTELMAIRGGLNIA